MCGNALIRFAIISTGANHLELLSVGDFELIVFEDIIL